MRLWIEQRRRQSGRPRGFTLVELLVVIVIITLLMGILVPTVQSVLRTMQQTEAKARLESLSRSVDLWYKVNNNHYPGQVNPALLDDDDEMTGSQLLAEALFTKTKDDGSEVFPASTEYADFSGGILFDYEVKGNTFENVLSDGLPTPMPILYYPSRLGEGNFKASDNDELVTDDTKGGSFGNVSGGGPYLLLSAGADRLYYTADDITSGNVGG
jgi:prepilin-type N-terminal cleavage/methylation domain-containing protein